VREWNDEVIFLYKLMEGAADHSYGIHVARLAGLPRQVIHRAREILSNLEINSMSADGIPSLVKSGTGGKHAKDSQPELFQRKENAIINELRSLDSNRMTPLEALTLIEDWKQKLKERNGHD
jgi:Mismatch repair ATPase (MutS family)